MPVIKEQMSSEHNTAMSAVKDQMSAEHQVNMPAAKKQMSAEHQGNMTAAKKQMSAEHQGNMPGAKKQMSDEHQGNMPDVKKQMPVEHSSTMTDVKEEMSEEYDAAMTAAKKQKSAEICVLIAPSRVGATRLEVNHVHGRGEDEFVVINYGQKTAELAITTVSGTGAITVSKPLQFAHLVGEEVTAAAKCAPGYVRLLRIADAQDEPCARS